MLLIIPLTPIPFDFLCLYICLMRNEEINALISLLDDPDQEIYVSIEEKILSIGGNIIADLEIAWENSFNPTFQGRIESLIHKIQFNELSASLDRWAKSPEQNLMEGSLLVARYQYPDLDEAYIREQVDALVKEVWLEINDNLTALEKVHIINRILFDIRSFTGNKRNYHAPQNSFINQVVESKKGNPLTLSIIYLLIAEELKLPVYGINLPEHFILGYAYLPKPLVNAYSFDDILFYINPFNKGQVFSKGEIDRFLEELKMTALPSFYLPCNNLEIIQRLLRNLMYSYQKLGDAEKEEEVTLLFKRIQDN
jgi:regulator of sirC expression with transglutaminase-like and TPR domain